MKLSGNIVYYDLCIEYSLIAQNLDVLHLIGNKSKPSSHLDYFSMTPVHCFMYSLLSNKLVILILKVGNFTCKVGISSI